MGRYYTHVTLRQNHSGYQVVLRGVPLARYDRKRVWPRWALLPVVQGRRKQDHLTANLGAMAMNVLVSVETSAAGMIRNYGFSADHKALAMANRLRDRDDSLGAAFWDQVVLAVRQSSDFVEATAREMDRVNTERGVPYAWRGAANNR